MAQAHCCSAQLSAERDSTSNTAERNKEIIVAVDYACARDAKLRSAYLKVKKT